MPRIFTDPAVLTRFPCLAHTQLCTEFKFFPVTDPQERGGLYELRTYDLKPGALLEWEHEWCVLFRLCASLARALACSSHERLASALQPSH